MHKFICLALAILAAPFAEASESLYFGYGEVHAMSGYPMVGMRVRVKRDVHAVAVSANACPLNMPKSLKAYHLRGLYLSYPVQKGPYLGGGVGFLNEPETMKQPCPSLEAAMGWELRVDLRTRIFFEIDGIVPFQLAGSKGEIFRVWPGLSVGCGF